MDTLGILLMVVMALFTAFWIWALVHLHKSKSSPCHKAKWTILLIVLLVLGPFFSALIYFCFGEEVIGPH